MISNDDNSLCIAMPKISLSSFYFHQTFTFTLEIKKDSRIEKLPLGATLKFNKSIDIVGIIELVRGAHDVVGQVAVNGRGDYVVLLLLVPARDNVLVAAAAVVLVEQLRVQHIVVVVEFEGVERVEIAVLAVVHVAVVLVVITGVLLLLLAPRHRVVGLVRLLVLQVLVHLVATRRQREKVPVELVSIHHRRLLR
jgi:hypothetical protein